MGLFDKMFGGEDPGRIGDSFAMTIEDIFHISGRGVVVTGKVASGVIKVGVRAVVRSGAGAEKVCRVTGIELARENRDHAAAGENVGVLLTGIERDDVKAGDTLKNAAA